MDDASPLRPRGVGVGSSADGVNPPTGGVTTDGSAEVEKDRIKFLLKAVAQSRLTFNQGGQLQDARQAAEFLRERWRMVGPAVRTPRDFIAACAASVSSGGQADSVILRDGRAAIPLAVWLETVLYAHELTGAAAATTVPFSASAHQRIHTLLPMLTNGSVEERDRAVRELIAVGPDVLPYLDHLEAGGVEAPVKQRCARVREAVVNHTPTALDVLVYIEKSGATFYRPGARHAAEMNAREFSTHLQSKALLTGFSLNRPASEFINEVASSSSRHNRAYKMRLPQGQERDVKSWLLARFDAQRPGAGGPG